MSKARGTVLVTGANRGIGFEVCRQLGRAGVHVLLTARNEAAGEEAVARLRAEGLAVDFEQLDVASAESVEVLAARLEGRGQRLSALINNAAISMGGVITGEVAERVIEVNFFGAWRLAERLLPLLEEHGRLVNVSSGVTKLKDLDPRIGRRFDPPPSKEELAALVREFVADMHSGEYERKGWISSAYRISKVALNALTRVLARELKDRHVLVNSVCPGWVRTQLGGPDAPLEVEEGAGTIVWAALLPPEGPTGGFFRDRQPVKW